MKIRKNKLIKTIKLNYNQLKIKLKNLRKHLFKVKSKVVKIKMKKRKEITRHL